jgi:hypothetical protein
MRVPTRGAPRQATTQRRDTSRGVPRVALPDDAEEGSAEEDRWTTFQLAIKSWPETLRLCVLLTAPRLIPAAVVLTGYLLIHR